MPTCLKCNEGFSRNVTIEGKKYFLQRRLYCLRCSPFKKHNTAQLEKTNIVDGKIQCECQICERKYVLKRTSGHNKTICNSCRTALRRYKIKKELLEYKGCKCERCGYNKNIKNLEFHHLNPAEKDFDISTEGGIRSIEEFKKEVDKCILVCTICHRDIHDEMSGTTKRLEEYLTRVTSS